MITMLIARYDVKELNGCQSSSLQIQIFYEKLSKLLNLLDGAEIFYSYP